MEKKKIRNPRKPYPKTEPRWDWHKNYRVWHAIRKIFLYPENWIEPELPLSPPLRVSLIELALFIRPRCYATGVRILLAGKNPVRSLVAAQTLAHCVGKKLYRTDLSAVVSKYIGETEKNLGRVFDAARRSRAVLFFDEVDALFGKRTEVKDSHDRYANIEINYLLRRCEKYGGLTILGVNNRTRIHKASMRRFHFIIPVSRRRKLQGKKSPHC